jgi:hypothetical protein
MVKTNAVDSARSKLVFSKLLFNDRKRLLAVQNPRDSWHTVCDEPYYTSVKTPGQTLTLRVKVKTGSFGLVSDGLRAKVRAVACRHWAIVANDLPYGRAAKTEVLDRHLDPLGCAQGIRKPAVLRET